MDTPNLPPPAGVSRPLDWIGPDGLLAQVELLEQIIEGMPHPVYVKDLQLRYRMCNSAYERTFGANASTLRGLRLSETDLVPASFALKREEEDREILRSGLAKETRLGMPLTNGRQLHALSSVRPLLGPDRLAVGLLGVLVDVTELHAKEQELARKHALVEGESQSKSLFLANVSHEIRTPLNAILGQLELLAQSSLPERERERVDRAFAAGEGLRDLVDKVLDYARVEGGMLEEQSSSFLIRDLLWSLEDRFRLRTRDKGIGLLVEIDPELDGPLLGDGIRLSQALAHLLDNAVKFTSAGGVVLTATLRERRDELVMVRISVADTGIGMAAEMIPDVFRPFQQADRSRTRRFGGTGLGLSLCHRLVEFLGGNLAVESEPGQGSTFHVDLPLRPCSLSDADDASPHTEFPLVETPLEGMHFVIVGVDSWRRGYLVDSIVSAGATVHVMESLDAQRVLLQRSTQAPDAILVHLEANPGPTDQLCRELTTLAPDVRIVGIVPAGSSADSCPSESPRWQPAMQEPFPMEMLAKLLRTDPANGGAFPLAPRARRHPVLDGNAGRSPDPLRRFLEQHRSDLKDVVIHVRNAELALARATVAGLAEAARQLGATDLAHRARRLEGSLQVEAGLGEEFSLTERAFQDLVQAIERLGGGEGPVPPPPLYPGASPLPEPELLTRVKFLLRRGEAEILDLLEAEESSLQAYLGSSRSRDLAALVRSFDFDGALALVQESFPSEAAS